NARYPFIVLNLELPATDVDVNVHPSKKEVRYKNTNQIFNFIYSSVNSAISSFVSKPMGNVQTSVVQINSVSNDFTKGISDEKENDNFTVYAGENISNIFSKDVEVEPSFSYSKNQNSAHQNKPVSITQQTKFIETPEYKTDDVIIGQYKKTYILIEKENGLEIVDQHIADERYIYETLKKSKNIDCQLLFISDVIEISPSDKELLETNKDKLGKYGYDIDFISDHEIIFRKVPQLISKVSPKEILSDILENISGDIDNIEEKILITTSCKAAVKANTYLNQYQMEEIIRNWRTCKNPETCPHGRPIAKFFEHKDLAKFFQRSK
ncbi:MAG: hypothetical protein MJ231_05590, partial [bacterium]|nr:hypothetical protein [bacterium]